VLCRAEAVRDVDVMPALARILREHELRLGHSLPTDFVFVSTTGGALNGQNVARRGLEVAMERAGLDGDGRPRLRFHDLRHCFASLLIAEGLDGVYVSRQLGHANPAITFSVYAKLFDRQRHADHAKAALEARFGGLLEQVLEPTGGDQPRSAVAASGAEVVAIPLPSG
jgi:integrase